MYRFCSPNYCQFNIYTEVPCSLIPSTWVKKQAPDCYIHGILCAEIWTPPTQPPTRPPPNPDTVCQVPSKDYWQLELTGHNLVRSPVAGQHLLSTEKEKGLRLVLCSAIPTDWSQFCPEGEKREKFLYLTFYTCTKSLSGCGVCLSWWH